MDVSLPVRGLRAAVFAALCVLLAAGGHVLATGVAPPVWAQAAGFAPVFVAAALLAGRERSLAGIGGGTLAAQSGLHLAFEAARPHAVMAMHGMRMAHTHAMAPHATSAHIAAAVLMTWWLRWGEAAMWSLLRRAVALVPGLVAWWGLSSGAWSSPAAAGVAGRAADERRLSCQVLLRYAVRRRGPPVRIWYAI
ncbi:hypothetical protein ACGFNV_04590 [Streptomyces sp. NPDC048751]|uniref:hypothetical protein n=1 Tax=Streptomyces sp. NPDC048751 TaxID=3365591 RepID=UPI003720F051